MDAQFVFTVSRLSGRAGRAWRIQWQVHVQSVRLARRFLRHVAYSHSPNVSKFLSTGKTLAVQRSQTRTRSRINPRSGLVRPPRPGSPERERTLTRSFA